MRKSPPRGNAAPRCAGILLAGGRARRIGGGDKCLLSLQGRPLLAHIVARLRPQLPLLALNAQGDPSRFAAFGLTVIADGVAADCGPLAGVLAGMEWARRQRGITHIVTVPTDAPFLPIDLVRRLSAALAGGDAEIATARSRDRTHPTVALWPVALAQQLRRAVVAEGLRKIDLWTAQYGVALVDFDGDPDPFFNINRPQDLQRATGLACRIK